MPARKDDTKVRDESKPNGRRGASRRASARKKPRKPREVLTIHISSDIETLLSAPRFTEPQEAWLLPAEDGVSPSFGSGLDRLFNGSFSMIRLWIHNRQAPLLQTWEALVRLKGIRVALLEKNGLEKATKELVSMGATVILDRAALIDSSGALCSDARCLLDWVLEQDRSKVQVHPFSWMLGLAISNRMALPTNRFGLVPGRFRVTTRPDPSSLPPESRLLVDALLMEERTSVSEFWSRRESCSACTARTMCAGHMTDTDGSGCSYEEGRAAVKRISAFAVSGSPV